MKMNFPCVPLTARYEKYGPYLLSILFFAGFKLLYPKPDLFFDSVNYLEWAVKDFKIAYRPLGYPHFLQWFIGMQGNYIRIVVIQFLIFLFSSYCFLETLFVLLQPSKWVRRICLAAVLFNPVAYFLVNNLGADNLFVSLSALWMGLLLRSFFYTRNRGWYFLLHLACFFCLLALRPNALYYPFFGIVILLFMRLKNSVKLIYTALYLMVFFFLYNKGLDNTEQEIGVRIYSGFAGWAMANNAIHIYNAAEVDGNIFADPDQLDIHKLVLAHRATARYSDAVTDKYMWDPKGPLKMYLYQYRQRTRVDYFNAWWELSPMYRDYGMTLVKHYPFAFFKAFFWPNFIYFLYPPSEAMGVDNPFQELTPEWVNYLGMKQDPGSVEPYRGFHKNSVQVVEIIYAVLSPLCILFCLFVCIQYFFLFCRTGFKPDNPKLRVLFVLSLFYLVTIVLLIFAHMVLLRYVLLPLMFFNLLPFLGYRTLREHRAALKVSAGK
jgi:hypothetical protein